MNAWEVCVALCGVELVCDGWFVADGSPAALSVAIAAAVGAFAAVVVGLVSRD